MGTGPSVETANDMLDAFDGGGSLWAQMHLGDPGADGTANAATNTERAEFTLPAASGTTTSMTTVVTWASVWSDGQEEISHLTFWTASTGGSFRGSVRLSAPVTARDGYVPRLKLVAVTMPGVASD